MTLYALTHAAKWDIAKDKTSISTNFVINLMHMYLAAEFGKQMQIKHMVNNYKTLRNSPYQSVVLTTKNNI
jgi:hypothetical protein